MGRVRHAAELAETVEGPVFVPGVPGYTEEAAGFDRSVEHRPALIVGASHAGDVAAAVRFAGEHGLGVAVQATGHGVAVPADGGALLITTRRMNRHRVDPARRTAWLEAGVLWQDVIATAAAHGLAPLSGSAPFVGAVSYILGGGIGVLARRYGYAADHVRGIRVITADGELRTASEQENPELFWALRGGKGNFGVVTALEADLMEVPRIYAGGLFFPAESTREVLHLYRRWAVDAPDELSSSFLMTRWPDEPLVPAAIRGRFALHVRLSYSGSPQEGARLVEPLRKVAPPLLDTVTDIPYAKVGTVHNDPPAAGSYHINTLQLTDLAYDTVEAILHLAGPESRSPLGLEIRHLGGALARPPATANAVSHTTNPFQVYSAGVLGVGDDDAVYAAQEQVVKALHGWDSGMRTLNFMAGVAHASPEDVRQAFTGEAYARLVDVKTAWDPQNMFRFNHNIPPKSRRGTKERP